LISPALAQLRYRHPFAHASPSPAVETGASYCVLRVCPAARADAFWSTVRRRDDVPDAIAVLLGGRIRVEVTHAEAVEALLWAAAVPGWADAEPRPLFLYDPRSEL
jgi:hypothetical protein